MDSKGKGNIAEAMAMTEFKKRYIQVSIPFGDNARYDLIAEFNGRLNKIQVKYIGKEIKNNSIRCKCYSSSKNKKTYVGDVDYMVFYLEAVDRLIIVPIDDIGEQITINIRLENKRRKNNPYYIENYTFDKIINNDFSDLSIDKEIKNSCEICPICNEKIKSKKAKMCIDCYNKIRHDFPVSKEDLKEMILNMPFTKIGEKYNVSDNAVRKWCKYYELPYNTKTINEYKSNN